MSGKLSASIISLNGDTSELYIVMQITLYSFIHIETQTTVVYFKASTVMNEG